MFGAYHSSSPSSARRWAMYPSISLLLSSQALRASALGAGLRLSCRRLVRCGCHGRTAFVNGGTNCSISAFANRAQHRASPVVCGASSVEIARSSARDRRVLKRCASVWVVIRPPSLVAGGGLQRSLCHGILAVSSRPVSYISTCRRAPGGLFLPESWVQQTPAHGPNRARGLAF